MSRRHLLPLLTLVLWLRAAPAHAEDPAEAPVPPHLASNIEWFEANLGLGQYLANVYEAYSSNDQGVRGRLMLQADLLLFNVHHQHLTFSILELHPAFLVGFLGGGTRLGARFPLTPDFRHELRVGSFVGVDAVMSPSSGMGLSLTTSLRPFVQYVRNYGYGSMGVGLDGIVGLFMNDHVAGPDGHDDRVRPFFGGLTLYFRFSLGRTAI